MIEVAAGPAQGCAGPPAGPHRRGPGADRSGGCTTRCRSGCRARPSGSSASSGPTSARRVGRGRALGEGQHPGLGRDRPRSPSPDPATSHGVLVEDDLAARRARPPCRGTWPSIENGPPGSRLATDTSMQRRRRIQSGWSGPIGVPCPGVARRPGRARAGSPAWARRWPACDAGHGLPAGAPPRAQVGHAARAISGGHEARRVVSLAAGQAHPARSPR